MIYLIGLVGFVLSLLTALVMVFFFFLAYYCILYTLFKKIGKYLNYVIIFFGSNPFIYIFESIRHRTWDLTKPLISCCRVSSVWLSRWETDTMYLPFITYNRKWPLIKSCPSWLPVLLKEISFKWTWCLESPRLLQSKTLGHRPHAQPQKLLAHLSPCRKSKGYFV